MPDVQDDNQTNIQQDTPINIQPQKEDKPLPEIKYPPFLWLKSQDLIKKIEEKINSKVLVYYTSTTASISNEDVDFFFSHVKELQSESSIALILISNGGSGMAAWRIANLLKKYCKDLTVIVPTRCASAATLLALSADKILFGPAGYLTAIDTSLNHQLNPRPTEKEKPSSVSVDQINKIKDFINEDLKVHPSSKSLSEILFEKIHPIVLGELQRSSNLSKMIAKNMIGLRNNPPSEEDQNRMIDVLNDSYPAHGYPIVFKEAQQIGLPVEAISEDINNIIWELVKVYSLISKRIITDINQNFRHIEEIPVLIDSSNRRTFFSESYNKRISPTGFSSIENDKTKWLSAIPDPEFPEKCKISEIEL